MWSRMYWSTCLNQGLGLGFCLELKTLFIDSQESRATITSVAVWTPVLNEAAINSSPKMKYWTEDTGITYGSGKTHYLGNGQNHTYTVYIRYFWPGNHQIYGHIRCTCTVLASPSVIRGLVAVSSCWATADAGCPIARLKVWMVIYKIYRWSHQSKRATSRQWWYTLAAMLPGTKALWMTADNRKQPVSWHALWKGMGIGLSLLNIVYFDISLCFPAKITIHPSICTHRAVLYMLICPC